MEKKNKYAARDAKLAEQQAEKEAAAKKAEEDKAAALKAEEERKANAVRRIGHIWVK